MSWDDADFASDDPLVRFNAHQAAKGNTPMRDPDLERKHARESDGMSSLFPCSLTDADLVRGCAPEQPATVEVGQSWMNCESGQSYPVASVRGDVITGNLVRLGTGSYVILLSEDDLRDRYVCTDPPANVKEIGHAT